MEAAVEAAVAAAAAAGRGGGGGDEDDNFDAEKSEGTQRATADVAEALADVEADAGAELMDDG